RAAAPCANWYGVAAAAWRREWSCCGVLVTAVPALWVCSFFGLLQGGGSGGHAVDAHQRPQPPLVADLSLGADETQRQGRRRIGAGTRETQFDIAGLDDAPAVYSGEGRDIGRDGERHARGLARLQGHPLVTDQADHRPRRLS